MGQVEDEGETQTVRTFVQVLLICEIKITKLNCKKNRCFSIQLLFLHLKVGIQYILSRIKQKLYM